MIDNPLEDKVLKEYDELFLAQQHEEYIKDFARKLAEDNSVFEELIEDFQDWFYMYCIDHPEDTYAAALPDDSTLIDDWWDWVQDFYKDEYNSPYDIDPTPDGDSPYSDAEYIITPQERDRKALESKRESHGRGNPFNW